MTGPASPVGSLVENPVDELGKDPALDRLLDAHVLAPIPEGLAARIIATVPGLPQIPVEADNDRVEIATVPSADARPGSRWRRYAVPVGLGGLAAAAASLAAVFLASAQGWQAPAASAPEAAPALAAAAPAALPSGAPPALAEAPALPADARLPARRTPAATPVLALGKAGGEVAAPGVPAPVASAPAMATLASNSLNPEASEPPIQQLSPTEAAEIERRAARRAAREEAPLPGGMPAPALGLRPTPVSDSDAPR